MMYLVNKVYDVCGVQRARDFLTPGCGSDARLGLNNIAWRENGRGVYIALSVDFDVGRDAWP